MTNIMGCICREAGPDLHPEDGKVSFPPDPQIKISPEEKNDLCQCQPRLSHEVYVPPINLMFSGSQKL